MGRVSAEKAAMHNMMVDSLIILDQIEKGKPDKAANWCKSFIVEGNLGRSRNPLPIVGFLHFIRYRNLPVLNQRMASKLQQVTDTYKPNIIDLSSYKVKGNESGFTVEMPVNECEPPGTDQPPTKPADKAPAKGQPSPPTPKDGPR